MPHAKLQILFLFLFLLSLVAVDTSSRECIPHSVIMYQLIGADMVPSTSHVYFVDMQLWCTVTNSFVLSVRFVLNKQAEI